MWRYSLKMLGGGSSRQLDLGALINKSAAKNLGRLTVFHKVTTLAGVAGLAILAAGGANAETCGGVYRVQAGDSLSMIADSLYKDAGKWTVIHQQNLEKIGPKPNNLTVGMKLQLLCINGLPTGLEGGSKLPAPVPAAAVPEMPALTETAAAPDRASAEGLGSAKVTLITGDDYAPFTDRKLPEGGLFTELMKRIMEEGNPEGGFSINWVNDWNAHVDTLVPQGLVDITFPWTQPTDCASIPEDFHCVNFLRSEPMFEQLVLIYQAKDRPFPFQKDSDMEGKHVCRPTGYPLWDLDQYGRNWLKDQKIKLEQPLQVGDCFRMLVDGKVDAVLIDEFAGRASVKAEGLGDQVEILIDRPLHIEALHVLVSKSNPRGQAIIDMVNSGLAKLKAEGEYQRIIGAHMARFWSEG